MTNRTRSLCIIGVCAALLCIGAWIAVPVTPPFTMQSFVLILLCLLFPGKPMLCATVVYLLLGAVGLPVFAGFHGGIGTLFGPTGGFLFGFLFAPLFTLIPCRHERGRAGLIGAGLLCCYLGQTMWYALFVTGFSAGGLLASALACVVPFILPDLLKGIVAFYTARSLKKWLRRTLSS